MFPRPKPCPPERRHGLLLVIALPLLLPACDDLAASTIDTRTTHDGTDTVHVVTEVAKDLARFHCLAARGGQCRIVVYTRSCERDVSLREARIDEHCTTQALARLEVPKGATRELRGLPATLRQCAGDAATPDLGECAR
jgi:hypothetical protein